MPTFTKDPKQRDLLGFFGRYGQPKKSNSATPASQTSPRFDDGDVNATQPHVRNTTSKPSSASSSPLTSLPSKSPETPLSLSKRPAPHASSFSSQSSIPPQKRSPAYASPLPVRHSPSQGKPRLDRVGNDQRDNIDQRSKPRDDDVIVLQPRPNGGANSGQPPRPAQKSHHGTVTTSVKDKKISRPAPQSSALKRKRDDSPSEPKAQTSPTFITISSGTPSPTSESSSTHSSTPVQKSTSTLKPRNPTIGDSESDAEEIYPAQQPTQAQIFRGQAQETSGSDSDSSYLGDPGIAEMFTNRFRGTKSKSTITAKRLQTDRKLSLAQIVERERNAKDAQNRIREYQEKMENMDQVENSWRDGRSEQDLQSGKIDKELLASMVQSKEGDGHVDKVAQALDRAEVMRMEVFWSFFENHRPSYSPPPFPSTFTGSRSSRFESLQDSGFRKDAFLTGFVKDWVSTSVLPRELSSWLWDSAICEPREDLAMAYLGTLQASPTSLKSLLSPQRLQQLLLKIGAKSDFLSHRIRPIMKPLTEVPPVPPPHISRLIEALFRFSHLLSLDTKMCAIHGLIRLALDSGVAQDQALSLSIEKAIMELVDSIPISEADDRLSDLASSIAKAIDHPILAHRIVSRIPDASPCLHLLRRRLALYYFCRDGRMLSEPLNNVDYESNARRANITNRIIEELENSPNFDVYDQDLDYQHVSARLSLLDIGVAGGFCRPSYMPTSTTDGASPAPKTGQTKANPYKEVAASPCPATQKRENAKNEFNSSIDRLAKSLRSLGARIVDPGAAHLTRTEAKGVLERIVRRLMYGVRIKPLKEQSKKSYLISNYARPEGSRENEADPEKDDDDMADVADAESEAEDESPITSSHARRQSQVVPAKGSKDYSNGLLKEKRVRFVNPEDAHTPAPTAKSNPPNVDGAAAKINPQRPRTSASPLKEHATDRDQQNPSSPLSDLPSSISMFNSGSDPGSTPYVASDV